MTLTVNPFVELQLVENAGTVTAITVRAPGRATGLQFATIDRAKEPGVFSALLVHSVTKGAHGPATDLTGSERDRLRDIGFLLPADQIPHAVRFACDLDDPPIDLIPARLMGGASASAGELIVNPTLQRFGESGPPPDMRGRARLPNAFRADRTWLWVAFDDLIGPALYSYPREGHAWFDALRPGQPVPSSVPQSIRNVLATAGVAAPNVGPASSPVLHTRRMAAQEQLKRDRYVVLPRVVAPLQIAALRAYYRDLIAEGFLPPGDADWPNRYFARREPITHFFHQQFTDIVSAVAGEPVKPSFPFFTSYRPGSDLPPHRDREPCIYSMSVQLDHSPEPADLAPWPIVLTPSDSTDPQSIALGIGDALLFRGREVLHSRSSLTEGYSSLWFFFYVPVSFDGPLD